MPRDQIDAGLGVASRRRINLSPDMLANIHGRLSFLDRLAFASVFRESSDAFKPEAPWLVLPGETPETATLFSLADRHSATVRAPNPALLGHAVLGSSRGWLATADARGRLSVVNPVTGEQRTLPAITTIPCLEECYGGSLFVFQLKPFARGPPYAGGGEPCEAFTLCADQMRSHLYRKVVLSDSPGGGHVAAAMLITGPLFGVAAFATAEDAAWRLAPSRDGVEDAIFHNGRFYSVTYSGVVEVWEHDAYTGVFTSAAVTPRLADVGGPPSVCRKYLVAAPGGQLIVVLKTNKHDGGRWTCSFKVQVLDGARWNATNDIGEAALFVGANESLCVSTRVHPELKAGRVYYTEDDLCRASSWMGATSRYDDDGQRSVGVFCLKDGAAEDVEGHKRHRSWPPPAWFTPSIP